TMAQSGPDHRLMPFVYVVVLNWNLKEMTAACVASLLASDYPRSKVMVVDNGSTDGSRDYLIDRFPGLEVIETGRNLGYAAGNNLGIRNALAAGADLVLLLNNDTVVEPSTL